jgi:signal transduction histidine kinase
VRERTAGRLAWTICGLSVAAMVADQVLFFVTPQADLAARFRQTGSDVIDELANLGLPLIGAVIASRRPKNPLGWLLLAAGAGLAFSEFGYAYTVYATEVEDAVLPQIVVLDWLSAWSWTLAFAALPLLLLLFPTGKLHSRRWRPVLWITVTCSSLLILSSLVGATIGTLVSDVVLADEITASEDPLVERIFVVLFVVLFLSAILTVVALVSTLLRFHASRGDERLQLRWFALAASFFVGAVVVQQFVDDAWISVAFTFASLGLYGAIGIAILKYRLYDIEIVIRKTLMFAIVAAAVTGLYVLVVIAVPAAVIGLGSGVETGAVLVGVAIGLLVAPIRTRARRLADRLVYGKRATPYEVLAEFSGRVGETYSADDVLPRMAQVLAAGTGADDAAVWLKTANGMRPTAVYPPSVVPPADLPDDAVEVLHQGELLGALSVRMPASDPMDGARRKLVEDLAAQAGLVLRNVRLIEELRASRQRLVAAQDEERRKLERNIHDGAQQQLVALAVQQRLAASLIGKDDDGARRMLEDLQTQTNEALEDLRDLARGIFPPLLADKGLSAALEAQARKGVVPVAIQPDGVGRYPQQIESAVYFSVLEALQNVAKYADATRATVRLSHDHEQLTFEVTDDGRGFDTARTTYGTGLQGIADRLAALDGSLEVMSAPGDGTTVAGRIPVAEGSSE